MKKIFSFSFLLLFCLSLFSQNNIEGAWSGTLDLGSQKLRLVFHISKNETGYSSLMDSPDQNAKGIPVQKTIFEGTTLSLEMPQIQFSYEGVFDGKDKIEGAMTQFGNSYKLNLEKKDEEALKVNRPQEPVPPFPYLSEDVKFKNQKENFELAGTLTLPVNAKKCSAVVLVSGSGLQNRDEEILEHKPFLVIADYLTRKGIAVLRYDDRGFAKSGGDPKNATTMNFADDAMSAIDYLRTRTEIDSDKIGVIGHSEGGLVGFILAAQADNNLSFVVSMAGSAIKGDSLLVLQTEALKTSFDMSKFTLEDKIKMKKLYVMLAEDGDVEIIKEGFSGIYNLSADSHVLDVMIKNMSNPWMRFFLKYDPQQDLRKIKCPVLAINGQKDSQVTPKENLGSIKYNIEKNGNKDVTVKEYPSLNHLFQTCKTGHPSEYGQIEETISPQVLDDIASWILTTIN